MSDMKPPSQTRPGLSLALALAHAHGDGPGRRRRFYRQRCQAGFAHAYSRPIEDERDIRSRTFSPQAAPERKGGEPLIGPGGDRRRSLAGITILQLAPALRDDPPGRGAVDNALAVLQSGARAIVAGDNGPLAGELRAAGGEWLPMRTDTFDPLRIRAQRRSAGEADRQRARRYRACAERRRRLERHRRHRPACRCFWSRRFPTGCRRISGR